jgi:hypothetical protein
MECNASSYGNCYIFSHRSDHIAIGKQWLPLAQSNTWHGAEGEGRWTKEESVLTVDLTDSFSSLTIEATNYHPHEQVVEVIYGGVRLVERFNGGERKTIDVDARVKAPRLAFRVKTFVPPMHPNDRPADARALGIFVNDVRYR